jgi:hypothetical protein
MTSANAAPGHFLSSISHLEQRDCDKMKSDPLHLEAYFQTEYINKAHCRIQQGGEYSAVGRVRYGVSPIDPGRVVFIYDSDGILPCKEGDHPKWK